MITILWLIRSFQPIISGSENFWENDWFMCSCMTLMIIGVDFMIIFFISPIINNIL